MTRLACIAVLAASLVAALPAALFAAYPDTPQAAAAAYLASRGEHNVKGIASPDLLRNNGVEVRGKTLEVAGRIVGRSVEKATDCDSGSRVCLMLQSAENLTLFVDTTEDMSILRVGQAVRALVTVPAADGIYGRCKLESIVLECDLPPDKRAVATTATPLAPPAQQPGTQAIPTQSFIAIPRSEAPVLQSEVSTPPPPKPLPLPQSTRVRPATSPDVRRTVDIWKAWVAKHNRSLTDEQCELIVRWVIYYSAVSGVDHRLSFSMISAESDFHPECLSHAGAMGLTQLMPCNLEDYNVGNPWNVQDNIRGGIAHMADMLSNFRGRSNYDQFALGLAAYNAGLGRVKRAGGIPNIRETIHYVKRVGDTFYGLVKDGYP